MTDSSTPNLATLTVLNNSNWFRGVAPTLLREIAALTVQRRYSAGETVFHRDQPGDYLYGVIAGSIRVTTQAADGRQLALRTMLAGDLIGEIAVLDGGKRTASGHALEETLVFMVPREQFTALMMRRPTIALHMIEVLCARVRQTSQQVEDAAFLTLSQRLARLLEKFVAETGGRAPCTITTSQSELGSFLNASRQAVNGALQKWQKAGFITLGRGRIEVHDLAGVLAADE